MCLICLNKKNLYRISVLVLTSSTTPSTKSSTPSGVELFEFWGMYLDRLPPALFGPEGGTEEPSNLTLKLLAKLDFFKKYVIIQISLIINKKTMKKIKLFVIILLVAFIAIPVFAQSESDEGNIDPVPTLISEKKKAENMEKSKALREEAKNKKEKAGQLKSEVASEHRSAVANFIQELLDVADRQVLGGIGEQVREIAKQQNASEDKVTPDLEKIKNKNKIRKFLFGTDFKKTKEIKKEMQEAQKRLKELERTKDNIDNSADKAAIEEQIKDFQDNINNVLSEVEAEEDRFSLFGWIKKMFI